MMVLDIYVIIYICRFMRKCVVCVGSIPPNTPVSDVSSWIGDANGRETAREAIESFSGRPMGGWRLTTRRIKLSMETNFGKTQRLDL